MTLTSAGPSIHLSTWRVVVWLDILPRLGFLLKILPDSFAFCFRKRSAFFWFNSLPKELKTTMTLALIRFVAAT